MILFLRIVLHFIIFFCSWWCHFDDDVYVNVDALLDLLNKYDPIREYIYIGRRSKPNGIPAKIKNQKLNVQFLTGAGYCVSKSLQQFMKYWIGKDGFLSSCRLVGYADDVTLGAIITHILKIPLVESLLFHSPFDKAETTYQNLSFFKMQVTHSIGGGYKPNLDMFNPVFNSDTDPTRFLSIHCILYPDDDLCRAEFS